MPKVQILSKNSPILQEKMICVYCQTTFTLGDRVVACPACQSNHHERCWHEATNQCAVFGCNGTGPVETLTPESVLDDSTRVILGQSVELSGMPLAQRVQNILAHTVSVNFSETTIHVPFRLLLALGITTIGAISLFSIYNNPIPGAILGAFISTQTGLWTGQRPQSWRESLVAVVTTLIMTVLGFIVGQLFWFLLIGSPLRLINGVYLHILYELFITVYTVSSAAFGSSKRFFEDALTTFESSAENTEVIQFTDEDVQITDPNRETESPQSSTAQPVISLEPSDVGLLMGELQVDTLYQRALSALETGNWRTALSLLDQVIAREPKYGDTARYLLRAITSDDTASFQIRHTKRVFTKEYKQFTSFFKRCPACNTHNWVHPIFNCDGSRYSKLGLRLEELAPGAYVQCKTCHKRVPVYGTEISVLIFYTP